MREKLSPLHKSAACSVSLYNDAILAECPKCGEKKEYPIGFWGKLESTVALCNGLVIFAYRTNLNLRQLSVAESIRDVLEEAARRGLPPQEIQKLLEVAKKAGK